MVLGEHNKTGGSLPLINRNNMSNSLTTSTLSERTIGSGSGKETKSVKTAPAGGRHSRASLRSLRNTDVLRNSTTDVASVEAKPASSDIPRSLSGGQLNKLNSKTTQRANSSSEQGTSKWTGERLSSSRSKDKHTNSLRFHRVDVEWATNEDMGAAGVAVGHSRSVEDKSVESLQLEIMDLRPSTHGLFDSSFISVSDDNTREKFLASLGASDKEGSVTQQGQWEESDHHRDRMLNQSILNRRSSWSSFTTMSNNLVSDVNSLSGSIISNMSMSAHSADCTVRSGSSSSIAKQETGVKSVYSRKVKPLMVVVALASFTAAVIYILSEGFFERGFETLAFESKSVIRGWFSEDEGEEMTVREGERRGIDIQSAQVHSSTVVVDADEVHRLNQEKRRANNKRRAERARRAIEKARKAEGKKIVVANIGIGNA